jgi:hypothetical protein
MLEWLETSPSSPSCLRRRPSRQRVALGRGHAGGGAAVDAVHDHGVDGVVVTNLLNRLAKYTLLLN